MNIQQNIHPSQSEIDQLKTLFHISLEICREKAIQLNNNYPGNIIVLQIFAACQSLLKNYPKAIELYQACLDTNNKSIPFLNNFARNLIEMQDFYLATCILNDIKQKWNHPAIYFNLALTYERGQVKNTALLDEAVEKMELYSKNYPSFQQSNQKGLIHAFELNPQQNYDFQEMEEFQKIVFLTRTVFQNMLYQEFNLDTLNQALQKLHPLASFLLKDNIKTYIQQISLSV